VNQARAAGLYKHVRSALICTATNYLAGYRISYSYVYDSKNKRNVTVYPCLVKHHNMNMYAGVEVYTHAFLTFTLNRNKLVSITHQQAYQ